MSRSLCWMAIAALCIAVSASAQTVGFRNDGSGHRPTATPPTSWNEATGNGIAWRVKLDHWGNGEPIVVKDRLYLVQDLDWWNFDRVGPSLLCLDLKDGSILWQRELDHTVALPPEQARQAREDWIKLRKKYYQGWQICSAVAKEYGLGRDALNAAREKLKPHGMTIKNPQTVFNLQITDGKYKQLERELRTSHLWTCQWSQPRGQWCGAGYATPVSDGKHIYLRTGYGAAFCYDLDGRRIWTKLYEGDEWKKQSWGVSPVLVDGVLVIADSQNCHGFDAIGLDAATGKQLWKVKPWPSWEGYSLGSCQVLTVDGRHIVHLPSGRIIRPSDGKVLAEGVGRAKWTASTGAGDLLVVPFFKRKLRKAEAKLYPWMPEADSLVAYRLAWDGPDRIAARRLWVNPIGNRTLEISPVLAGGLVFQVVGRRSGIAALDAKTGKQVAMRDGAQFGRPKYSWNLAVAGGYLYAIDYIKGTVAVLKANRSLEVVATNPPLGRPTEETPLPYATWTIGAGKPGSRPRLPQTGAMTFAGDRLILRAFRYVYCLKER
ncbi:MAG: PQQ-binding-like beta-propeller repeat protein [Phycisphaerae bacterium]